MLIGELSHLSGAPPSALRYYESQGLLASLRTSEGHRQYPPEAADTVRQLRRWLQMGLTSPSIKLLQPLIPAPHTLPVDLSPESTVEVMEVLRAEIDRLTTSNALQQARAHQLRNFLALLCSPTRPPRPARQVH